MDNPIVYVVIAAIIVVLLILIILSVVAGKRRANAELEQELRAEEERKKKAGVQDGVIPGDEDRVAEADRVKAQQEAAEAKGADVSKDTDVQAGGQGVKVDEADADAAAKVGKGRPWDLPTAPDAKDPNERKPIKFTEDEKVAEAETARDGKAPNASRETGKGGKAVAGAAVAGGAVAGGAAVAASKDKKDADKADAVQADEKAADKGAVKGGVSGDADVQAGGRGVTVDEAKDGQKAAAAEGQAAEKGAGPKPVTDSRRQVQHATAATAAGVGGGAAAGAATAGVAGGQGVQVDESKAEKRQDDVQTAKADQAAGEPALAMSSKDEDRMAANVDADKKETVRSGEAEDSQGSGAGTAAVVGGTVLAGGAVAAGAAAHGAETEKVEAPKDGTYGAQTLKSGTDVPGTEKDHGDLMDEPTAGHTADGTKIETVTDEQLKAQAEGDDADGAKAQPAASGAAGTSAATGVTATGAAVAGAGAGAAVAAGSSQSAADKAGETGSGRADAPQTDAAGSEYEKAAQVDGYAVTGVPGYAGPVSERAQREIAEDEAKASGAGAQPTDEEKAARPMTGATGAAGTSGAAAGVTGAADKASAARREAQPEETLGEHHTPAAQGPVSVGASGTPAGTSADAAPKRHEEGSLKETIIETAKGAASVAAKGAAKGAEAGAKGAVKGAAFLRDKLAQAQERRWKK